jgi:hypothetical protein
LFEPEPQAGTDRDENPYDDEDQPNQSVESGSIMGQSRLLHA